MSEQTIIDTIDNAIRDWEVSADAMRWTPEQPPARHTMQPCMIVPIITAEQIAPVMAHFEVMGRAAQQVRRMRVAYGQRRGHR